MDFIFLGFGFAAGIIARELYSRYHFIRYRAEWTVSAIKWRWLVRVGMKSLRVRGGYRCPLVLTCNAVLDTPKKWYEHTMECFTRHYVRTFVEQRCLMCNSFTNPRRYKLEEYAGLPWRVQAYFFKDVFYPDTWACENCAKMWRHYQIEVLAFDDTDEYHFAFENLVHDWLKRWKKIEGKLNERFEKIQN